MFTVFIVCVCVCVRMYVCMYVCMYVHMYVYIRTWLQHVFAEIRRPLVKQDTKNC